MPTADPIVHRGWKTRDHAAPLRTVRPSAIDQIIRDILPDGCERTVLVGPVVVAPPGGADVPPRYVAIVSNDGGGPFVSIVGGRTHDEADELREEVRLRLLRHRIRPCVHLFRDELEMARWAEAVWPGPVTTGIRRTIEAERRRN